MMREEKKKGSAVGVRNVTFRKEIGKERQSEFLCSQLLSGWNCNLQGAGYHSFPFGKHTSS